ncbi:hypothetical protein HPB47_002422 [Ixodes persulcatus]|uniref:Uncharacterized protein n=1 Tax=Ixodes persulcatus TaxID=34615 RepID=A0AC60PL99_IXOPE|nr:hypothetical protein HPB47_002422 [Ixodes persulcatus]
MSSISTTVILTKTQSSNERDRVCTLVFDEMVLKKNLAYDVTQDVVQGFTDDGIERSSTIADRALVVLLSGISKRRPRVCARRTHVQVSKLPPILTAVHFPFDGHLLGDGAYPLRKSLLVSYRNNGRLTEQHRKYNRKHATTRVAIVRAFGILKERFRRLRYIEAQRPERNLMAIVAACVMHNACVEWRDIYDGPLITKDDGPADDGTDSDSSKFDASSSDEVDSPTASRDMAGGKAKRDFIMHSL